MILTVYLLYAIGLSAALGWAGHRSRQQPQPNPATPRETPLKRIRRVLVVGASGGTGTELVDQALERGYHVTAMVREPSRLAREHPQLEIAVADVLDAYAVRRTVSGHDAVLCALGHGRYLGPSRILSEGTGNILDAMRQSGVRRLVCETSLGIGDSAFRMGLYYTLFVIPVILPFYYWDKTRQEELIAESGLEWVIVRPAVLTDGTRTGRIRHGFRIGSFVLTRRIARSDVAHFMLDQLEGDEYLETAPGCAGGGSAG